ncbi:MAG: hypothetical protein H6730_14855 [Deltaproteobacteria bacterium]|nr:hypothetical protein [Deltaproteobacteria bacterium]
MSRELLSGVGGRLEIELSEPPERITPTLVNERATPTATILSVHLDAYVFEDGHLRPLRDEELSRVELKRPTVTLRSHGGAVVHHAQNGRSFTVSELLAAIVKTERKTRAESTWFKGVDVHHVFFQGIHKVEEGVFDINWGS